MSHTKRFRTMLWSGVAGMALMLGGAPASAMTLEEAISTTLTSNPEIGAVRSNQRAIEQELRQARGLYLPQVDARGAYGYELTDSPATRSRAGRINGEGGGVGMQRYETGLTVQQLIFDGFATDGEVERQLGRVDSARYRIIDTAEAVGLDAAEAYLDVRRAQEVVELGKENVNTHQDILALVESRSDQGLGTPADTEQARARLAAAKADLAQSYGRLNDAMSRYLSVVGIAPENLQPVNAPELDLPSNVDEAVSIALDNAPSIQAAEADINTAQATVKVADAAFMPEVNLEVSAGWNKNVDGTRGINRDLQAMVVGNYNLYRGGIDTARRRETVARLAETRDVLDQTRREVEEQVRLSWSGLNAARERRVALAEQVDAVERVLQAYQEQFRLGQRTLLDLLDIQNELFVTRTALVTEDSTVKFGVYRTLASMGKLLEATGVVGPEGAAGVAGDDAEEAEEPADAVTAPAQGEESAMAKE